MRVFNSAVQSPLEICSLDFVWSNKWHSSHQLVLMAILALAISKHSCSCPQTLSNLKLRTTVIFVSRDKSSDFHGVCLLWEDISLTFRHEYSYIRFHTSILLQQEAVNETPSWKARTSSTEYGILGTPVRSSCGFLQVWLKFLFKECVCEQLQSYDCCVGWTQGFILWDVYNGARIAKAWCFSLQMRWICHTAGWNAAATCSSRGWEEDSELLASDGNPAETGLDPAPGAFGTGPRAVQKGAHKVCLQSQGQ